MEWNHILNKQPEDGESIIQIDPPYEGHHPMGMRTYVQKCSFEDVLKYYDDSKLGKPNFWWISAKDFPFPDQPERSKREDSCKHQWGSEEKCDSKDAFYICSKCGYEMRCSGLYGNIET